MFPLLLPAEKPRRGVDIAMVAHGADTLLNLREDNVIALNIQGGFISFTGFLMRMLSTVHRHHLI